MDSPTTLSAASRGARAALQQWPLVGALWLIGAGFGAAFALVAAVWLGMALEGSLATRTLLEHLDTGVLVDLWYHHREGLVMLAVGAALLAAVHVILWWWLDGVIVAACAGQPRPWLDGLALAPVMARLYVLAAACMLAWTSVIASGTWALLRTTRESPEPYLWAQLAGGGAVVWALGMVGLIAIHDHARLRAGLAGADAAAAWTWATGFVLAGGEGAVRLAFLLQAVALLLFAIYRTVSFAIPLAELLGLTGSLLLGEIFLLARTWVRVWFFTAQRELHP